jgi:hypothetical protein
MTDARERNGVALLRKADEQIHQLRDEVERLKKENRSLKTEGSKQLEAEKAILLIKIASLEAKSPRGESEAILNMRKEVSFFKETNARLMLRIEELSKKLKAK